MKHHHASALLFVVILLFLDLLHFGHLLFDCSKSPFWIPASFTSSIDNIRFLLLALLSHNTVTPNYSNHLMLGLVTVEVNVLVHVSLLSQHQEIDTSIILSH